VISSGERIATETTAPACARQATILPTTLADARARLLELIRRRPEPPAIVDARWWQRNRRRADAAWVLQTIPNTTAVATAINVTPRTVQNWRHGNHAPTPRHWRQLRALHACSANL
jgi:hypothetical protein